VAKETYFIGRSRRKLVVVDQTSVIGPTLLDSFIFDSLLLRINTQSLNSFPHTSHTITTPPMNQNLLSHMPISSASSTFSLLFHFPHQSSYIFCSSPSQYIHYSSILPNIYPSQSLYIIHNGTTFPLPLTLPQPLIPTSIPQPTISFPHPLTQTAPSLPIPIPIPHPSRHRRRNRSSTP
jgi:hypothetical protein